MPDAAICPICGGANVTAHEPADGEYVCGNDACRATFAWPQPEVPEATTQIVIDVPTAIAGVLSEQIDAIPDVTVVSTDG
jgi:hypothetical protein